MSSLFAAIAVERDGDPLARRVDGATVRREGDRLRIIAQLDDAKTGEHVWAERYDRELTDFFEVQDEITKAVTVALQVNLDFFPVLRL